MGEARINGEISAAAAGMALPSPDEMKAIEALSARFACAMLEEGLKLPGPSAWFMARMLVFVTAGRLLAHIGEQMSERPESVQLGASQGIAKAVVIAQRQRIADEGRKLAMAAGK